MDARAPILETIQLGCACGVELVGGVLTDRMKAAVALFVAHHHGPACAPRWREVTRRRVGATPAECLTPDRICGGGAEGGATRARPIPATRQSHRLLDLGLQINANF